MAFDFPSSPTLNQTFTPVAGTTYVFRGVGWELQNTLPDSLTLVGDPKAAVTPAFSDNDSSIATTAMVQAAIAAGPPPQCGRLTYVSATQLAFKPFNGDRLKLNGAIWPIPAAGIAGLSTTNLLVNGTAGQSLAASTNYLIFVTDQYSPGVLTADFRSYQSGLTHAPSQTFGNGGVETMWYSSIEYPRFTLIGMIRTNASAQFVDNASNRFVISWFNRRFRCLEGGASNTTASAAGAWTELGSQFRVNFLSWGDENVYLFNGGCIYNDTNSAVVYSDCGLDGGTWSGSSQNHCYTNGWYEGHGDPMSGFVSEGFHFGSIVIGTNTGTAYYALKLSGMIRG